MKQRKSFDRVEDFEKALNAEAHEDQYLLKLYVSGTTPRSARAIQNIRNICDERLQGRYELEVVDLYQYPEKARPEHVVVTPTLVKSLPLPMRKLIGDLSSTEKVLMGLDLVLLHGPKSKQRSAS